MTLKAQSGIATGSRKKLARVFVATRSRGLLWARRFCETSDARTDPGISEAVVRFIEQQGARSVATVDRIIGCPHEEGVDYPEGEACPLCPFWRNRDRWSGEIIG